MSTTDNNKLLAEFMGYVNLTPTDKDFNIYEGTNKVIGKLIETNFEKRFHTDWNWLMEVVEKVESLGCRVEIINSTSKIEPIITHSEYITKIEAVYNACVEFVKWYNEQNKI